MSLPFISGEFGVVTDPEIKFSDGGRAWAKIRGAAKDRVRDATGKYTDGDPLYIDIIVSYQAEHLIDSIAKGDSIIVSGRLKQRTWEKDGEKRISMEIRADEVGVSVRWNPAKTPRALENGGISSIKESLGAEEIQSEIAPF